MLKLFIAAPALAALVAGVAHAQTEPQAQIVIDDLVERPVVVIEQFSCSRRIEEDCVQDYFDTLLERCLALGFDEVAGATDARPLKRSTLSTLFEATYSCRIRARGALKASLANSARPRGRVR